MNLPLRLVSEFSGTLFLLMVVVGSGVMGENLAQGNTAIALLANALATGAGLYVLIQVLGPVSGAHFNPWVSALETSRGRLGIKDLLLYLLAQFSGAIAGVVAVHAMFGLSLFQVSGKLRADAGLGLSEGIATFGLLATIVLLERKRPETLPQGVAAYIFCAYWFTASTSFANPAVTVARMFTDTFCGIAPQSAPLFLVAQALGAVAVLAGIRLLPSK
jgi:glycerol uptake facilitator-like aquaporin